MTKMTNVNSSLAYEILLYLNSFYLGMFFVCEVAMGILKAINVSYPENSLMTEVGIFCAMFLVEVFRIFLGRRGNLASKSTEHSFYPILHFAIFKNNVFIYVFVSEVPVFFSVLLTIPSAVGVCYFLIYQTYILRLEYIWCAVMLMFHALELTFAILFILTICKNQQYE